MARWLSTPISPDDIHLRDRLAASLVDHRTTVLISGASTAVAATTAWMLTGAFWALLWLIADVVLTFLRLHATERARNRQRADRISDLPAMMAAGLAWAFLIGIFGAICMAHNDPTLAVLGAVVVAGHAGGISSRNAATPRYGLVIIAIAIGPLSIGAALSPHWGINLTGILIPIWALGTIGIMRHNHAILCRMLRAEAEMRRLAMTDTLTGLYNRAFIDSKLQELCEDTSSDDRDRQFVVLMLDLDGFKPVNDVHGHHIGDGLLQQVSARLSANVRQDDFVCRFGGDEFVIFLVGAGAEDSANVAQRIVDVISEPFDLDTGQTAYISASVGSSAFPTHSTKPKKLLAVADQALYAAKHAGKGRYVPGFHVNDDIPARLRA